MSEGGKRRCNVSNNVAICNPKVIHELLCHPNIDVMATDSSGNTAEKLACAHIKNTLVVFK